MEGADGNVRKNIEKQYERYNRIKSLREGGSGSVYLV